MQQQTPRKSRTMQTQIRHQELLPRQPNYRRHITRKLRRTRATGQIPQTITQQHEFRKDARAQTKLRQMCLPNCSTPSRTILRARKPLLLTRILQSAQKQRRLRKSHRPRRTRRQAQQLYRHVTTSTQLRQQKIHRITLHDIHCRRQRHRRSGP